MDTAEKRIARAEALHAATPEHWIVDGLRRVISGDGNVVAVCPEPHLRKSSEAWPVNRRFIAEARSLLPALAADAKRAIRYERNLCSIAKVLTDAGVPLTVETADGPTIDRIHERVAHLVDAAKRLLEERKRASEEQDHLMETVAAIRRAHAEALLRLIKERGDLLSYQYSVQQVIDLLRQYQAACARWAESKDPRDEAEVVRLRGQLAIVALPKGGE